MLEKEIENNIIEFLRCLGWGPVYKIQNIGMFDPIKRVYRKPSKNYIPGVPDIYTNLPNGRAVWIEVKNRAGRPTEDQLKQINELQSSLAIAFISRSVWQTYNQLLPFWPEIKHFEESALLYKKKEESSIELPTTNVTKGRMKRSRTLQK